ncbi:MAG TPA: DUF61 family protein [Methanolinea sp.]|nr:DUF61 family protein [Methanolinea sp.]HQK55197.1 DUF61 family protein [Methanolinea sp.]
MRFDESVLRRWMSLEMGKINDGVVSARVPLSLLLEMERPVATTRGGKEHVFDRGVIRKIGATLPLHLRSALKLPIVFYFDMEVSDSCMLADEVALAALQELGDLSIERRMENGKAWVGRALVFALLRKYPSAVQIMMG